jgi:inhibitor of cysteine peptidase
MPRPAATPAPRRDACTEASGAGGSRRGIVRPLLLTLLALLAVSGLPAALPHPAEAAGEIALTDADDGKSLRLAIGDDLVVSLEGNPTTGYVWKELDVPPCLERRGDAYRRDEDEAARTGRGGRHEFRYGAKAAGAGDLVLVHLRPWEKDVPPARRMTFHVEVAGDGGKGRP